MPIFNCDTPNWKPLDRAVELAGLGPDFSSNFMWMCEEPEGTHQYKHRETRNYALLRIDSELDDCRAELASAMSMERTWGSALDNRLRQGR